MKEKNERLEIEIQNFKKEVKKKHSILGSKERELEELEKKLDYEKKETKFLYFVFDI